MPNQGNGRKNQKSRSTLLNGRNACVGQGAVIKCQNQRTRRSRFFLGSAWVPLAPVRHKRSSKVNGHAKTVNDCVALEVIGIDEIKGTESELELMLTMSLVLAVVGPLTQVWGWAPTGT